MKILFNEIGGEIFYVVADRDWFLFSHSTNIPLTEFQIDEIAPVNQIASIDIVKHNNKFDVDGDKKYHMVDNAGTWELHEKDGWEEDVSWLGLT